MQRAYLQLKVAGIKGDEEQEASVPSLPAKLNVCELKRNVPQPDINQTSENHITNLRSVRIPVL